MGDGNDNLSKDYVEHLRTVHFSLIALCLGAVVLAFTPDTSEIQQARREIAALLRLKAVWEQDPNWIQSAASTRYAAWASSTYGEDASKGNAIFPQAQTQQAVVTFGNAATEQARKAGGTTFFVDENGQQRMMNSADSMDLQRMRHRKMVVFDGPNWIIAGPYRECAGTEPGSAAHDWFYPQQIALPAPAKLSDFRACWGRLAQDHTILVPSQVSEKVYLLYDEARDVQEWGSLTWYAPGQIWPPLDSLAPTPWPIHAPGDSQKRLDGLGKENADSRQEVHLLIARDEATAALQSRGVANGGANYIWTDSNSADVVPVIDFHKLPFEPVKELIERSKEKEVSAGGFAVSFPNLDSLAGIYGEFDVDKLDGILKDLQNRTGGESFQVFGVKIPASATTRWGVMVVLSVQLYFWMHLSELRRRLLPEDAGWNVAFIGMYPTLPARIVYYATSCALPVLGIVALCVKGILAGENRTFVINVFVLGTIVSLALAVAIWRSSPKRAVSG